MTHSCKGISSYRHWRNKMRNNSSEATSGYSISNQGNSHPFFSLGIPGLWTTSSPSFTVPLLCHTIHLKSCQSRPMRRCQMDPSVTLTSPSRSNFSVCLLSGMNHGSRRSTKAGRIEESAAHTQRFLNCADSSCKRGQSKMK